MLALAFLLIRAGIDGLLKQAFSVTMCERYFVRVWGGGFDGVLKQAV